MLIGSRLGPYEVLAKLGEGGMGEVYRAKDTRLKRDVAIKVLPDAFTTDVERLARFQREAELLATLNHPNIAQIYGIEDRALILELVDGPTLADRIAQGPIPLDEALPIARQIAEALEAAHERGVIHRDLKPANIKLTPDGKVKVLDFGLAKAMEQTPGSGLQTPSLSHSPTMTSPATMGGVILGTAPYMSPEQARGKPVDKRVDIWAFGCVLYEMLTGRCCFAGHSVSDTIAAVLMNQPDWSLLPQSTPQPVRHLIRRCMEKDSTRRLRDIGEARIQLDGHVELDPVPLVRPSRARRVVWALALGVAAVATTAIIAPRALRRDSSIAPVVRFSFFPPEGTVFSPGTGARFSVSPDGRQIAFVAETNADTSIWVQPFESVSARQLPGTSGVRGSPFWSADGNAIAFMTDDRLKRIDVDGTAPRVLCDLPAAPPPQTTARGSWSADGIILFPGSIGSVQPARGVLRVFRVPATGGTPSPVTPDIVVGPGRGLNPTFLPDGRHFIFTASGDRNQAGIWIGSVDATTPFRLVEGASQASYVRGNLVFVRDGVLMVQSFDPDTRQLTSEPQATTEQVTFGEAPNVSASQTGVLAYTLGLPPDRQFLWVDRSGREIGTVGQPAPWGNFDLSPDGNRLVASLGRSGLSGDLWSLDLSRGVQTRLTFSSGTDGSPVWSPDGERIAFTRTQAEGQSQAVVISASGGKETVLTTGRSVILDDWSPDGRLITFNRDPALMALPVDGGDAFPFVQTGSANLDESHFSPDGKWIAYNSNESGRWEVYLAPFPPTGERWQISANGGVEVRWRADGKELFYLGLDGQMIAVDVRLTPRPAFGDDRVLFRTGIAVNPRQDHFAVTADGQQFLIRRQVASGGRFPITVVLNWQEEWTQRVPAR